MSYIPPALDKVNFELDEYISPVLDQVNFELADFIFPLRLGLTVKKKLGRLNIPDPYGVRGIYRTRVIYGKRYNEKLPIYSPFNPQTEAQQANRQKYANGVSAWQGLTDEQKDVYNEKAKGKRMSGYNLFLSEYLKS